MADTNSDSTSQDTVSEVVSSGQDSDVESSHSICSGSDTHSGHTSLSGATEKGSCSGPAVHINSTSSEGVTSTLLVTANSPEPDAKYSSLSTAYAGSVSNRGTLLPWGATKDRPTHPNSGPSIDMDIRPGEFVMRTLFAEFTLQAERKIESVMFDQQDKPLSKVLQRREDAQFDQLLSAFGSVAEHCLPSLLRALFSWYERQIAEVSMAEQKKVEKAKSIIYMVSGNMPETVERSEDEIQIERRDLAVEFIFCLILIEVLRQLSFHPGHEDLVQHIENIAFKHFKYRDGIQTSPNAGNIHIIADLYAEVIGELAKSRFMSVRTRFMAELKELRSRDPSPHTTQSIISLLMGMKFFRVKMVPIEEFEASFQFMQECAQYFLEVKDKDIKHALAGLFVEILVPVAASVKNEVNVPCLKNFVEMLYSQTLDASTKSKHRLALFPLVTCLLCVSQKTFFLQNWHCFLAMCLSHLKNRELKMSRVALESLYRLLWVYMIRIKCESNSATQSRLQSIVNSLFPKGSKGVIPRDTPLNIFVKIIQFIAQERLDFAMREIVFDLLSVGRPVKIILTPERMNIGLRAFLVVADSLQQSWGEPPMPRAMGVLPSGNTLRVMKKTFLNKALTDDVVRNIGMGAYFPHVKRVFVDILRALDGQDGRPLMMTTMQNVNKEPDEMITGERKPRIDLFRTCVAAVPRLILDVMKEAELVDLLSRLTVHMDEELRGLAYLCLQTLVVDFIDWRQFVLWGFTQFLAKEVLDTFPQLVDNGMKMLLQLLTAWKTALTSPLTSTNTNLRLGKDSSTSSTSSSNSETLKSRVGVKREQSKTEPTLQSTLHLVEAFALVMLCNYHVVLRKLSVHILREVKTLQKLLNCSEDQSIIDVMDQCCPQVVEKCLPLLPPAEKTAIQATANVDMMWLADRNSFGWTAGLHEDGNPKNASSVNLNSNDAWSTCLFGFLERDRILSLCPTAVSHTWPLIFYRLNSLYPVIDPTPVNDNRASLLRSSTTVKKPLNERDIYIHVWKNYITFAFRVVPPVPSPIVRCASPDLSLSSLEGGVVESGELSTSLENLVQAQGLVSTGRFTLPLSAIRRQHKRTSSSPDSLSAERTDTKSTGVTASPTAVYKLVVPLLRCEVSDVRDAAVLALGNINSEALKDLMEELVVYIREAVDRKQENVRRRRRRDALRLQLIRVLELIAEYGTFGISSFVLDRETLHPSFVEYMDGARLYLESETDKNSSYVKEIVLHFCSFIRKMIISFNLETCQTLLKRDLRKNLFMLFSNWSGSYGAPIRTDVSVDSEQSHKKCCDLQITVLQAMSALLCCGKCFKDLGPAEDEPFYQWLDVMFDSKDEKVYSLARETVVLLLECNPDVGSLLDWAVDRCYTGTQDVADGCFLALATIFSAREEYPCDHYTAIINVTLMNTGCPRPVVRDTALQLLQLLDKRFFGAIGPLAEGDLAEGDKGRSTLDTLLATTYCRSQIHLSSQLSHLHPELTMPMFSEITHRFQTARPEVRQLLLQYLLPWLHNMELVDPNVPPTNPLFYYQFYANELGKPGCRREGWGSAEATEMVLNNIFYITVKFGDNHPKEMEEVWATLCTSWPNNMKVIIRYLIIISGMAPTELLPYAKRVILYLARVQTARLLDEMMFELQTVETLNCLIERTETPPFYRLTVMRKASSHSDGTGGVAGQADSNSRSDLGVEKGTIHTKRHSGEDPTKCTTPKADQSMKQLPDFNSPKSRQNNVNNLTEDICTPTTDDNSEDLFSLSRPLVPDKYDIPQPHPLPMPEYGGYFAPLTEYLPDSSQPISGFHRCNVAVMLLCDVVVDGIELDWKVHVPLMLHILFLGLDHTRPLVHQHCKQLLLNLLIVLAQHNDHLTVAHILLNSKTNQLGLGLTTPTLPILTHTFTEPDPVFDSYLQGPLPPTTVSNSLEPASTASTDVVVATNNSNNSGDKLKEPVVPPVIVTPEDDSENRTTRFLPEIGPNLPIQDVIKSLIDFLATRQNLPLWPYEDITAKVWQVRSADQIDVFLQHVLRVFQDSLPSAHVNERWAQTALQLGLSCSSRHYAGRSLQIYRALRVPITSRMLSDILSRLVETVAEQGEDMQGYVTELLLTLESAVDYLESDFRPLDFMRDFFKSTPNLNNKESVIKRSANGSAFCGDGMPHYPYFNQTGHTRSTSYSVSYCLRKTSGSPASDAKEIRGRTASEIENRSSSQKGFCSNLSRSRSAQSLKLLGDSATQDDKMTILAQLFWLSVSLLESDYEHEFLLALRLLARVLHRLPLDRPDARDKVEKLQSQLRWNSFPGVHALLLKGCTHPNIYEPVVALLSQFTPLLDLVVVDPSQSIAFPMNVIALLPYMLLNYEDANELCTRSAENIAQVSIEKSKKLENLGTVMNLYSRRTFSKESFQWTKCVIKYLYDTYSHLSLNMLTFLVEVLEKGPSNLQLPVLNILHCMLHYIDLASAAAQPINADLLRVIARYIDGAHWKESLKILKLVVTRSSSLVAPPTSIPSHWESALTSMPHPSFSDADVFSKKELPGRTMDFTFDLSQTPVIGRRFLKNNKAEDNTLAAKTIATPRRSCSLSPADTGLLSGWKRPWMSQGRVRECLVNLLTTCGQRVGLPKSPSVIFSQSSDILERQSSMASSTEEVSAGNNDLSGGSRRDDATTDFGVFKDFDFLEYESESIEGESTDNFNWGVRRRPLSEGEEEPPSLKQLEDSISEQTPVLTIRKRVVNEESSDDEIGSESPLDEIAVAPEFENSSNNGSTIFTPTSLSLTRTRKNSSARSDTSGSSAGDLGDVTPCNASPNMSVLMNIPRMTRSDTLETWTGYVQNNLSQTAGNTLLVFHQLQKLIRSLSNSTIVVTRESCGYLFQSSNTAIVKLICSRLTSMIDIVNLRILPVHFIWFNSQTLNSGRLLESLRYGMLEVQEHLETFCDKREQATMFSDAVKTSLKLELLSGQSADARNEDYLLDLARALYKLHFQLLLLIEAANKMISTLFTTLKSSQFKDSTQEILLIRSALNRAIEDTEADGGTPTPVSSGAASPAPTNVEELETTLYEYITGEKWSAAISFMKHNRGHLCSERECNDAEDDIDLILNIYCKRLVQEKPDCFVMTNQEGDLGDVFGRLYQVSAAVIDLETDLKDRDQSDNSIASHSKD